MDPGRLHGSDPLEALGSRPDGLTFEEVRHRLLRYGPNTFEDGSRSRPLLQRAGRLLQQVSSPSTLLLVAATGLAVLAERLTPGHGLWAVAGALLVAAALDALAAFLFQDPQVPMNRTIQRLSRLLPATAWVIRAGEPRQVPCRDLVPGDILLLEEGEPVPADGRLLSSAGLRLDLSVLTGDPTPRVLYGEGARHEDAGSHADRPESAGNLVFAGSEVLSGHGRAVVTATGPHTELGRIATTAADGGAAGSRPPRGTVRLMRTVSMLALTAAGLAFASGPGTGASLPGTVLLTLGSLVAALPLGLLPMVALALAVWRRRLARRRLLVKRLASVEMLGTTTAVCTDLAGPLTEKRMQVNRLYLDDRTLEVRAAHLLHEGRLFRPYDRRLLRPLFQALVLCNNARRARRQTSGSALTGDPTDVALMEFALEHLAADGGRFISERFPRMAEFPFDTDRQRMTTLHWADDGLIAYVKGAPSAILPLCTRILHQGGVEILGPDAREHIQAESRNLTHGSSRVLAVATRSVEGAVASALRAEALERDLTFMGLVALTDPPRPEVPEAIDRCRSAGIRMIVVTGEPAAAARALIAQPGLSSALAGSRVIEARELDRLDDKDVRQLLDGSSDPPPLVAGIAPRHKLRLVSLLKELGHVVAVTGAGVHDVRVLTTADIGIALGVAGDPAVRDASPAVLQDDSFAGIVDGIEEGRAAAADIRRSSTYLLSSSMPQLVPYLAAAWLPIPLPLLVPQVLAVDLATDIAPSLALGVEPRSRDLGPGSPRRGDKRRPAASLLPSAVTLGLLEAALAMLAFFGFLVWHGWTWGVPLAWPDPLYRQAVTVTLAAIVVAQTANVFACRAGEESVFRLALFRNRCILWGIAAELVLLAMIVYTPLGHHLLGTAALPWGSWVPLIAGGALFLLTVELRIRLGGIEAMGESR